MEFSVTYMDLFFGEQIYTIYIYLYIFRPSDLDHNRSLRRSGPARRTARDKKKRAPVSLFVVVVVVAHILNHHMYGRVSAPSEEGHRRRHFYIIS